MWILTVRLLFLIYKTLTSSNDGLPEIEFVLENKNTTEGINVNKSWFFKNINEIDKSLTRLMKNKQTKKTSPITNIRHERD